MSRTDDILHFIKQYRKENNISPSLREIAAEEETSTSVIHYHITKLILDGRLRRIPDIARGLVPTEENNV